MSELIVKQAQYLRELDFTQRHEHWQASGLVPISGDRVVFPAYYRRENPDGSTAAEQVWMFVYQVNPDATFTELSATLMNSNLGVAGSYGFEINSLFDSSVRIGTTDRIVTVRDRHPNREFHLVEVGQDNVPRLVTTLSSPMPTDAAGNTDRAFGLASHGADSALLLTYIGANAYVCRVTVSGGTIVVSSSVVLNTNTPGYIEGYAVSGDTLVVVLYRQQSGFPDQTWTHVVLFDIPKLAVRTILEDINPAAREWWNTRPNLSAPLPDGRLLLSLNLWYSDANRDANNRHLILLDPVAGTLTNLPARQWPKVMDNAVDYGPWVDPAWTAWGEQDKSVDYTPSYTMRVVPYGETTVLVMAFLDWELFLDNTYGMWVYDWSADQIVGEWLPVWPSYRITRDEFVNSGYQVDHYALWPARTSSGRLLLMTSEFYLRDVKAPSTSQSWYQNLYLTSPVAITFVGGRHLYGRRAFMA